MKSLIAFLLILPWSFTAMGQQVPGTLSYQGILLENDGITPLEGAHTIEFNFYTVSTGGTPEPGLTRTVSVTPSKGLFTCIIGDGTANNAALPSSLGSQEIYVGIKVDGGTELSPRARLTPAVYAYQAQSAYTMDAAGLTGTIDNARLDTDLQDLADGSLTGSIVGSGLDAANITTGTVNNARLDTDLQDLADGSLTGSTIGTGINAGNITTGTLNNARLDAELQDLADGSLSGSLVGTGINAANLTGTNSLPAGVLPTNVPLGNGTNGRVAFWNGTSSLFFNDALSWDDASKRLGIGTVSPLQALDVRTGNIALGNAYDLKWGSSFIRGYDAPTSYLAFATNGLYRAFIDLDGNFGIGTTQPSATLDVAGTFRLEDTGAAIMISTDGSTIDPTALNRSFLRLSTNPFSTTISLNTTTSISDGTSIGQILIIQIQLSPNGITIPDNSNVQLNNSIAFTMTTWDTLTLIWTGTDWNEISRSSN